MASWLVIVCGSKVFSKMILYHIRRALRAEERSLAVNLPDPFGFASISVFPGSRTSQDGSPSLIQRPGRDVVLHQDSMAEQPLRMAIARSLRALFKNPSDLIE